MDIQLKTEPNSGSTCYLCLKNDVQIFGEHEIKKELLSLYKDLLKDYILKLTEIGTTEMCLDCIKMLSDIDEFRRKCISSVEILSMKSKINEEDLYPPISNIKEEIFVADLPVQVEMMVTDVINDEENQKELQSFIKNEKSLKKSLRVKSNIKKESIDNDPIKYKKPVKKSKKGKGTKSSQERKSGYCYICCIQHPTILNHVLEVHSRKYDDGNIRCMFCQAVCSDGEEVVNHLAAHREFDLPKKCGKCEMTSKSREELFEHIRISHYTHRPKVFPCDFCKNVYYDSSSYKYHIWVHLGAVRCTYCEKSLFDHDELQAHHSRHEKKLAEAKFICDFCGYFINRKVALTKHIFMNHVDVPSIKCKECEKIFLTKEQLKYHVTKHHKIKEVQCPECGRSFQNSVYLKNHKRSHLLSNGIIKLKKKVKPETREFACDQCDMAFYAKSTLKKHSYTHSKTRPFQCQMCSTGYYCNDYLRKHYMREHGVVYTPKEIRKICGLRKIKGDESD